MNIRELISEARFALPLPSEVAGEMVRVYICKREEPNLVFEINFKKCFLKNICIGWEFINDNPIQSPVINMEFSEGDKGLHFHRIAS